MSEPMMLVPGETVDVTIRGAVVLPGEDCGLVPMAVGNWRATINMRAPGVTAKRKVPADGEPCAGEIWADRFDARYFARAGSAGNAVLVPAEGPYTQTHWETLHGAAEGPIRRVWPESTMVAPAGDVDEDQADEPTGRAAIVAGLRQLADLIDANPDLPLSRLADFSEDASWAYDVDQPGYHAATDEQQIARVAAWGAALGIEPAVLPHRDGRVAHVAERKLAGLKVHIQCIVAASETTTGAAGEGEKGSAGTAEVQPADPAPVQPFSAVNAAVLDGDADDPHAGPDDESTVDGEPS